LEGALPTVKLKRGEDKRIRSGHLWIFSNEIEAVDGAVNPGDTVHVVDAADHFLGTGYINPHSLITVRLVSRSKVDIGKPFLAKRIEDALALRERLLPGDKSYRAVYGEADLLPGLIVDRYARTLAIQSLTAGIERWIDTIVEVLSELLSPDTIVLRNDSNMRKYEGLAVGRGVIKGSAEQPVEIEQDGMRFLVDVLNGQKTGFFLDQRENRRDTAPLALGQDVLDCCAYTGAWSVYAARAGAKSVTAIDDSKPALELAKRNLDLNGVSAKADLIAGDAFGELARLGREGAEFGLVILDPPSFAKSRQRIREALKAHQALNRLALSVTRPGGHVVTCNCSHLVERDAFMNTLVGAAREARRRARIVSVRGQAADHPVILGLPETEYLTCVVLEVI
jgi:23S rRNA (cytosine1962-C5)-methyltransferase